MAASNSADRRTVLSWSALATAIAICVHQRHFSLSLTHPDTFRIMLTHRCGDVLTAATLWAVFETALTLVRRIHRAPQLTA